MLPLIAYNLFLSGLLWHGIVPLSRHRAVQEEMALSLGLLNSLALPHHRFHVDQKRSSSSPSSFHHHCSLHYTAYPPAKGMQTLGATPCTPARAPLGSWKSSVCSKPFRSMAFLSTLSYTISSCSRSTHASGSAPSMTMASVFISCLLDNFRPHNV